MADQATQRMTIGVPPARCYEAVLDFERYPTWARDLKSATVLERDGDGRGTVVAFRAAAMGRSTSYTLRYDHSRAPDVLAWQLVEGDIMRRLDGAYEFLPVDGDAETTEVVYSLTVDLVVPLPGFVKRRAEARIINTALCELRALLQS
jgi:uncharacterized membrane protein